MTNDQNLVTNFSTDHVIEGSFPVYNY